MARQYYFGPTPSDEDCVQVGARDYNERARKEVTAYVKQLYRFLEQEGHPKEKLPAGFRISAVSEQHDLGEYFEVVCTFSDSDRDATKCHELGLLIDHDGPSEWDEEAKKELAV